MYILKFNGIFTKAIWKLACKIQALNDKSDITGSVCDYVIVARNRTEVSGSASYWFTSYLVIKEL